MPSRYFKSGATTWNSAANWSSTSSAGVDSAGVPTNLDDAIFDSGSGSCTVNVAAVCGTLNFTGYTGTITMTNGITVGSSTAGGTITLGSGMTITGSGGLTSNSTATLTSNGKTWPNNLTLTGTSKTFTLADAWTISGTLVLSGTTLLTLTINALLTSTSITMASSTTFNGTHGFTTGTFSCSTASGFTFTLASSKTYTVTSSLTLYAANSSCTIVSSSSPTKAILTFTGSTQDVGFCSPTDIDSSAANTIWSYNATITNTNNWINLANFPINIGATFLR